MMEKLPLLLAIAVLGTLPSLQGEVLLSQGPSAGRDVREPCSSDSECLTYCAGRGLSGPCCTESVCNCCGLTGVCIDHECTFQEPCPDTNPSACSEVCGLKWKDYTGCCATGADCTAKRNRCLKDNVLRLAGAGRTSNATRAVKDDEENCVCCQAGYKCDSKKGCEFPCGTVADCNGFCDTSNGETPYCGFAGCGCCKPWETLSDGICLSKNPCAGEKPDTSSCNNYCTLKYGSGATGCCVTQPATNNPNNNVLRGVFLGLGGGGRATKAGSSCVCCLAGYKCDSAKGCQCDPTICPDLYRCGGCYGGKCVESGRCGTGQLCNQDCKEKCVEKN